MASKRRRVPTNWVSDRMLQPSTEPIIANFSVPSDFLVEGQVSGLETVQFLLTSNFFSTWILPSFKRKTLSFVIDGLQKKKDIIQLATSVIGVQFAEM